MGRPGPGAPNQAPDTLTPGKGHTRRPAPTTRLKAGKAKGSKHPKARFTAGEAKASLHHRARLATGEATGVCIPRRGIRLGKRRGHRVDFLCRKRTPDEPTLPNIIGNPLTPTIDNPSPDHGQTSPKYCLRHPPRTRKRGQLSLSLSLSIYTHICRYESIHTSIRIHECMCACAC